MLHFTFVCLAVFLMTFFSILLFRPIAIRIDLVDSPDTRKLHQGDVPKVGGIAMLVGFLVGMLMLHDFLLSYEALFASMAILALLGFFDDFCDIRAGKKFLTQVFAATLMVIVGGACLNSLGNVLFIGNLSLGWLGIPFTIVAIVAGINAINMLDGVDGLMGSVSLIQFIYLAIIAFLAKDMADLKILMVIVSCLIGFLFFNSPLSSSKFKVFAGDMGTMLMGVLLMWFVIRLSQTPGAKPVVFLWIIAVPVFDLFNVVCRRLRQKKSPFGADREHLHHMLQNAGLKDKHVVLIIAGGAIVMGLIGIISLVLLIPEGVLFFFYVFILVAYLCRFGYLCRD